MHMCGWQVLQPSLNPTATRIASSDRRKLIAVIGGSFNQSPACGAATNNNNNNNNIIIIIIIIIIIFTKIYIAHMPAGKINRQIESEGHKKVDLTNV